MLKQNSHFEPFLAVLYEVVYVYCQYPFHATGLFRYPLKTSANLWFADVFKGSQKQPVAWNSL